MIIIYSASHICCPVTKYVILYETVFLSVEWAARPRACLLLAGISPTEFSVARNRKFFLLSFVTRVWPMETTPPR